MRKAFPEHYSFSLVVFLVICMINLSMLAGCALAHSHPTEELSPTLPPGSEGLTREQIATLDSLEKLDDHPLYTMRYAGKYPRTILALPSLQLPSLAEDSLPDNCRAGWGCALFAALGDPDSRLYGRNFDWRSSPALLLFTDPPDGFASVSMVDIEYLGYSGEQAQNLLNLSLSERKALLEASALPFDGMNEKGLAIGMAAVPYSGLPFSPLKKTIGELGVIREILDKASTIDEAVEILDSYNIDMSEVPLHYLIASAEGEAALVEFYQEEMVILRNDNPWLLATNFLVASTGGQPLGQCPRYDRIRERLETLGGQMSMQDALNLLAEVSQGGPQVQSSTQWSMVYGMTTGEIEVIMGQKYTAAVHTLQLKMTDE